jgi:hypothetical protein
VLPSLLASRHLQVYMAQPAMQEALTILHAAGELETPDGDIAGVFLQSGVSKLAVFQERVIEHDVVLAEDGSAQVEQTVEFGNAVPEGLEGDPTSHIGYLALIFRQRVAYRIPLAATEITLTQNDKALVPGSKQGPYEDGAGARVMWAGQDIPPGQRTRVVVRYRLPAGSFGTDGRLNYRLTLNPQAMTIPVSVTVRVRFATGTPDLGPGWSTVDGQAQWRGVLDRTLQLELGN